MTLKVVAVLLAKVRLERVTSAAGHGQVTTLGRITNKSLNNIVLHNIVWMNEECTCKYSYRTTIYHACSEHDYIEEIKATCMYN